MYFIEKSYKKYKEIEMYDLTDVRKMLIIVNIIILKKRRKVVFIHHQLLLSGDSNQIYAILS